MDTEELAAAIIKAIYQCSQAAGKNPDKHNLTAKIANLPASDGTPYQIQLSFIADKKLFLQNNEVMYSDSVQINTNKN